MERSCVIGNLPYFLLLSCRSKTVYGPVLVVPLHRGVCVSVHLLSLASIFLPYL